MKARNLKTLGMVMAGLLMATPANAKNSSSLQSPPVTQNEQTTGVKYKGSYKAIYPLAGGVLTLAGATVFLAAAANRPVARTKKSPPNEPTQS